MQFKYRFVGFGTNFGLGDGVRTNGSDAPSVLFRNELVVDIGGVCWCGDPQQRPVLDHHFYREHGGQFPSAAAAVLHHAALIRQHFASQPRAESLDGSTLWLVTHADPDFDAFCAMYLARRLLDDAPIPYEGWEHWGLRADGWFGGPDEIDWFDPRVQLMPAEYRWPVLLAAYAACIDNCRRLKAPRNRALHSVLYAALLRGRPYQSEDNGATDLFSEAEQAIRASEGGLNPLYDAFFETSRRFAPELAMLDREVEAYARDQRRARKVTVFVPTAGEPFQQWFGRLSDAPLLDEGLQPAPQHLAPTGMDRSQVDGLYLRDPECLLFKEWARNDLDNSPSGGGFLFSAIAYSGQRREAECNSTNYFFSLDPERARGLHLYSVWARLQAAEVRAEAGSAHAALQQRLRRAAKPPRKGYERRASPASWTMLYDDPWYDGMNYSCTIVATPNRGTYIGRPGQAPDLSDDPVAAIVRDELEGSLYLRPVRALSLDPDCGKSGSPSRTASCPSAAEIAARRHRLCGGQAEYCLGVGQLADYVEVSKGTIGQQIGEGLWAWLHAGSGERLHSDFVQRHLVLHENIVCVWSRLGVALAYRAPGEAWADEIVATFCRLVGLAAEIRAFIERDGRKGGGHLHKGSDLLRAVADIKRLLASPQAAIVRRFFEASHLDEVLQSVCDLNAAEHFRHNLREVTNVQKAMHIIEYLLAATYGAELWEKIHPTEHAGWPNVHAICAALVAIMLVEIINIGVERRSPILEGLRSAWRLIAGLLGLTDDTQGHPEPHETRG